MSRIGKILDNIDDREAEEALEILLDRRSVEELAAEKDNRTEILHITQIDEEIKEVYKNWGKMQGIRTGYPSLDRKLGGLKKGETILVGGDTHNGKALEVHTPVLTPTGWVAIGNLKVGDMIYDGAGKQTRVIGVRFQGKRKVYELTFNRGEKIVADEGHLWTVMSHYNWCHKKTGRGGTNQTYRNWQQVETKDLTGMIKDRAIRIPSAIVEGYSYWTNLDPYVMGVLLGDGGITTSVRFTTADKEIAARIFDLHYSVRKVSGKYAYSIVGIKSELRADGVLGKRSWEKSVPHSYLFNTKEKRLELLRGLMDTDGYIGGDKSGPSISFCSTSEQLAKDVAFLVQSLGGHARINQMKKSYRDKNGKKIFGRIAYNVAIYCPVNPFRLKRKSDRFKKRISESQNPRRWRKISKVTPIGEAETVCIEVESETHQFITDHCIVTHNSAFVANIARNIAKTGKGVLFITLEMRRQDIGARIMHVNNGTIDDLNMMFQSEHRLDYRDVGRLIKRAKQEGGVEIIFLDYLQYLGRGMTMDEVAKMSKEMKVLALENDVPFVIIVSLRKSEQGKGKRKWTDITIDDYMGTGSIGYDCDAGMIVSRKNLENEYDEDHIYVKVLKTRNWQLDFNAPFVQLDWDKTKISESIVNIQP